MANVLHIIDTTGPGGAEVVLMELVRHLDPARWHSSGVVTGPGWVRDNFRARGVEPTIIPNERSFDVGFVWRLRRVIRERRIDLVHAHLLTASLYSSVLGLLGTPVLSTFHGQVDVRRGDPMLALKFGIINRGARRIVFVSEPLRDAFVRATSVAPRRTAVIHNGVDTARFGAGAAARAATRAALGVGADDLVVGAVGNIRPAKSYDVLLHAARRLADRHPRLHVLVAGESNSGLLGELEAMRDDLGLRGVVRFIGQHDDVPAFLGALDAFVLTSSLEGFSIATIEAMASGLPVVATRSGGPQEILRDGETGLLVDVGDPEQVTDALTRVLGDRGLAQRLGARARAEAETRFSVRAMVGAYEREYDRLLDADVRRAAG